MTLSPAPRARRAPPRASDSRARVRLDVARRAVSMPWRGRVREARVPAPFDARRRARGDDAEDDDETGHEATKRLRTSERRSHVVASRLDDPASSLFAEHTFYFDGFVPGGIGARREAVESRGGAIALAFGRRCGVSRYVVEDYGVMDAQVRERWARGDEPGMRCVRASWISACIEAGELVDCDAHAPLGTPRASPKKASRKATATELDLVDLVVNTAWNGTGGVSTQERLRETWAIRVVFERVSRALADGKTSDVEIRKMSAKAYNALRAIVDEKWIVPVSACEALVDLQGTRNLSKRHDFASSQASPADVAQALEWIMVDSQGVNVDATLHNIRDDGWDPSWLRERASVDSGVMTRRASREAAEAAASQETSKDLQTLSQLSNIEDDVLAALDPFTRYEWTKARADRERQRMDRLRAEQSAAFQLLKACSSKKVVDKATSKFRRPTPVAGRSPAKNTKKNVSTKATSQMPITAYASPVKENRSGTAQKSCVGEPIMASTSVHTATLLHALERVLTVDADNAVDGRIDVAADIVRLHIEELARCRRKQEVKAVRAGVGNTHSDHPRWIEVREKLLSCTESLVT